jgi:hypothetical protein
MKGCSSCGRELPLAEFVRDARRSDGYGAICRTCKAERIAAGRRGERNRRFHPKVWHAGCTRCGEYDRNSYPGAKCRHPGAVQGALELNGGNRCTFIPEGHPEHPDASQ